MRPVENMLFVEKHGSSLPPRFGDCSGLESRSAPAEIMAQSPGVPEHWDPDPTVVGLTSRKGIDEQGLIQERIPPAGSVSYTHLTLPTKA